MHWLVDKGLKYIQFPTLAALPRFFHAVFLRGAIQNSGPNTSLNIGLGCGDRDTRVWENRQHMLALWNNPTGVFARQVHGTEAGVWSGAKDLMISKNAVRLDGDALITDRPDSALVIQVADCQPVILIDPVNEVVANVHSGWRSSIKNIIGQTIDTMKLRFGCKPEDLVAGIGPSLGPCCAEFIHYRQEFPESVWPYRCMGDRFNFWQLSIDQLRQAGVQRDNINSSGICTKCNPHLFFSYRAEKQTGRFASVVGIIKRD